MLNSLTISQICTDFSLTGYLQGPPWVHQLDQTITVLSASCAWVPVCIPSFCFITTCSHIHASWFGNTYTCAPDLSSRSCLHTLRNLGHRWSHEVCPDIPQFWCTRTCHDWFPCTWLSCVHLCMCCMFPCMRIWLPGWLAFSCWHFRHLLGSLCIRLAHMRLPAITSPSI